MFLQNSNRPAIHFKNSSYTFAQIHENLSFYSSLFSIEPQARVVIFSENRPEWIFAFYAIWNQKGVVIPVDYLSTAKELAYILKDAQPSHIFYSTERETVVNEAIELSLSKTTLISLDQPYLKPSVVNDTLPARDMVDTAVIIYTSGTTGSPKGVMLSYGNIWANITGVSEHVKIFAHDQKVMILLPLHHIFPLIGSMVAPLSVGAQVAIAASMASEDIMDTLNTHSITLIIGVPRLFAAIRKGIVDKINKSLIAKILFGTAKLINSRSVSKKIFKSVHLKFGGHIKYMISGGAALDPAVAKDFKALGFEILEGFGMTEASPMITFTRPNGGKIGSAGQVLPGTEMKILDGEILSRGPHIMQGYYKRPNETAEVIKDGWLYTGDIGSIDKHGYLFITGRKKEIIVLSNGKNINPTEIEFQIDALLPFAKELAVFEKDDILQMAIVSDRIKARELQIENIEQSVNKALEQYNKSASQYKRILKWHHVHDELPKTRLGKVQRFKLAELIGQTKSKKNKQVNFDSEEYRLIKSHIETDKNIEVYPDDHIEIDLGLDSLDKVSLQVFIENTFGVNINAEKIADHETVRRLSEFVTKMKTKMTIDKINWSDIIKEKVNVKLPKSDVTSWFIVKWSKVIFKMYFRFRTKGTENIPETSCIIAPNHQSYFDGMFVASALSGKMLRRSFFYTKAKHIKFNWLRRFAVRNNIIIVDVNQDLKHSIQSLAEALKKNKNVVIFPEGTRSYDGELGDFKKTFAILSKELNVPVVPVVIRGAYDILPRGTHFPKPFKKVSVEFLKPIFPLGQSYFTIAEQTKEMIQEKLS